MPPVSSPKQPGDAISMVLGWRPNTKDAAGLLVPSWPYRFVGELWWTSDSFFREGLIFPTGQIIERIVQDGGNGPWNPVIMGDYIIPPYDVPPYQTALAVQVRFRTYAAVSDALGEPTAEWLYLPLVPSSPELLHESNWLSFVNPFPFP